MSGASGTSGSRVVVLGGGVSGLAAACALAEAGVRPVTVLEAGDGLGGLARSFANDHGVFPLGYHHILHRDRTLRFVLGALGLTERIAWRRVPLLLRLGGHSYDLSKPGDFLRFPLRPRDKAALVQVMLRCFSKSDWSDWTGRNAAELIDTWGTPSLRATLFDPLARVKFELPARDVSAAWLGARLHFREGSSPLGYMPGTNWTRELCRGLARLVVSHGAEVRTRAGVVAMRRLPDGVTEISTADGATLLADWVVSTIPTTHYTKLCPEDAIPELTRIRYSALTSVIVAARAPVPREFYWMTVLDPGFAVSGLFVLDALNPSLGLPGWRYFNLVTHSLSAESEHFRLSDDELAHTYDDDLRRLVGQPTEIAWRQVNKMAQYSPVLTPGYENPPLRNPRAPSVFFAGNYRTFPSVVSTGTAMASGFEAARALLDVIGRHPAPMLRAWGRATAA